MLSRLFAHPSGSDQYNASRNADPTHEWTVPKSGQLFNPRRLLTLVKILRTIRERGTSVEEEKLSDGSTQKLKCSSSIL
jgi:adenine-specific DNA methylase